MSEKRYEIREKFCDRTASFRLTITADANDADYVTETEYFSREDFEEFVIDEILLIKREYSEPHQLPKYPNEFDIYIPYNGWDGPCHSLKGLTVEYIDQSGKEWAVVLTEEGEE